MRILLGVHAFPPEYVAGTEVMTEKLAAGLSARGHQVMVIYRSRQHFPEDRLVEQKRQDFRAVGLSSPERGDVASNLFLHNPAVESNFLRLAEEFRPQVVHLQHLSNLSANLVWRLKATGLPVVLTLHDFWFMCYLRILLDAQGERCEGPEEGRRCYARGCYPGRGAWDPFAAPRPTLSSSSPRPTGTALRQCYRLALRLIPSALKGRVPEGMKAPLGQAILGPPAGVIPAAERDRFVIMDRVRFLKEALLAADLVISPSKQLRDHFVAYGLPEQKTAVLRYGVDSGHIRGIPAVSPRRPVTFGYIGTFFPHKGLHVLIAAANRLAPEKARFLIAGHGDARYLANCRKLCRNPSVEFIGAVQQSALAEFLGRIDALVVPSIWRENWPVVIQEAFVARRPVITSDLGGMSEAVQHEKNGLLFEVNKAEDLARCLERAATEPELLARLAQGISPVLTTEESVSQHEQAYQDLLVRLGESASGLS